MPRLSSDRAKKVLFSATLALLTLTVCLVILEVGFARFYYSNVLYVRDKEFDAVLGWRLRPGTTWIKPPHAFVKHPITVNEHGLRDRDVQGPPPPGRRRVLVLGDSFVFAKVIPRDRIFTTRLESLLNGSGPARYEVVNAGVPGYGTAQQLLFLEDLAGRGITADLYVLTMFTNDILDNLRLGYRGRAEKDVTPGFALDEHGDPVLVHAPERTAHWQESGDLVAVQPERAGLKLFQVLELRIESFLQTKPGLIRLARQVGLGVSFPAMPALINGWYVDEVIAEGIPLTRALLREVQSAAARHGGRLVVTLVPSSLQVYPETYGPILTGSFPDDPTVRQWREDPQRPQRMVGEMCRELEIPFLDLLPVLIEHNHEQLYVPREGHFSQAGHAVVAEALAELVRLAFYPPP